MCGIAGVLGLEDATSLVVRMSSCIAHRGQDGDALDVVVDARGRRLGAFAHRRLSVLDLSAAGRQPMLSSDGNHLLVFNGEIYNFRTLRRELERDGGSFSSGSDTEVILEGWRIRGAPFLASLRGMFAIALWSQAKGQLVLARDEFGIKPLYYAQRAGVLAFASEIRALREAGVVDGNIASDAAAAYLSFGSVPEPLVILDDVRTLAPGTMLTVYFRDGQAHAERHMRFASALAASEAEPLERDMKRGAARVRAALQDSVAHHLVSDVPVGLFLSGGVDSSALVAIAAETADTTLDTFTVAFDERAFDETMPAREVAKRYRTRHTEIRLTASDFLQALPAAFRAMDQPSLDGLNTYVVSRAVHEAGLKVVLSGLGGDEMFAGYASFRRAWSARSVWGNTALLRRSMARLLSTSSGAQAAKAATFLRSTDLALGAYRASRALFAGGRLSEISGRTVDIPVEPPPSGLSLLQRVSWYELTGYMRSVLLRDSDVFSMAHHLELRVPFVDREVARSSMALDDSLKVGDGGKRVLVEAVRDLLPRSVWDRPKQGFTLPFAEWLRGVLADEVSDALRDPARTARVGLRVRGTTGIWEDFMGGTVSWSRPWALYTLIRWSETHDISLPADGKSSRVA